MILLISMLAFRLLKQDSWKWKLNPSRDQFQTPADYYRQLVQASTQNRALGKKREVDYKPSALDHLLFLSPQPNPTPPLMTSKLHNENQDV